MLYDRSDKTVKRGVFERIIICGNAVGLRSWADPRMISKIDPGKEAANL
jgi:hypothetical protein